MKNIKLKRLFTGKEHTKIFKMEKISNVLPTQRCCTNCKVTKSSFHFRITERIWFAKKTKQTIKRRYLNSICNECVSEQAKQRYKNLKEQILGSQADLWSEAIYLMKNILTGKVKGNATEMFTKKFTIVRNK